MQTLKIKYKSDNIDIIKKYIQQYNSEHVSYKILSKLNNIEFRQLVYIICIN